MRPGVNVMTAAWPDSFVIKIARNVTQNTFLSKLMHYLSRGKNSPKMWAISTIFTKLPKVNNHALVENSPNLFALTSTIFDHFHFKK
jgi:hypothetical protein